MISTEYFEVVSNTNVLRGLRHISNHHETAYIIVHGYFSSNKIGPHRLYVTIANLLAERFGDAFRFDLSGMGESDGDISQIKLKDQVEDLRSVVKHVSSLGYKNIIIISHCMGCNLALEILKQHEFQFREVVFLAPYFTSEDTLKLFFTDEKQLAELYVKGYTYRNCLYADRSFFLENSFYDSFIKSLNDCGYCINVIAAGKDQFIPFESNELLRINGKNVNFFYLPKSDHNFINSRDELKDMLVSILSDDFHA